MLPEPTRLQGALAVECLDHFAVILVPCINIRCSKIVGQHGSYSFPQDDRSAYLATTLQNVESCLRSVTAER